MHEDNCGNIVHFNSINSEIIGQKFTKFVHDLVGLLPFIFWERIYDWPIRCRTPKLRVKVVPCDICKHLLNLTGCHSNVPLATVKRILGNYPHQYACQTCKVGQDRSRIFLDIWHAWCANFGRIDTKGVIVKSINSGVSVLNVKLNTK